MLEVDNNGPAAFSYTEKGSRSREKPSIVFVHGLSSNKETWLPILKVSKHCVLTVSRYFVFHMCRIFHLIIIVSLSICLVMEKQLVSMKTFIQLTSSWTNLNWYSSSSKKFWSHIKLSIFQQHFERGFFLS